MRQMATDSPGWNYPSSKSNFTINYPVDQTATPGYKNVFITRQGGREALQQIKTLLELVRISAVLIWRQEMVDSGWW